VATNFCAFVDLANRIMRTATKPKRRPKELAHGAREATPTAPAGISFPIIGIGTSAGGLEALEHFLSHVPKSSGLAFVIVHAPP
jgi:two-component system CheB/CheR fusion protein